MAVSSPYPAGRLVTWHYLHAVLESARVYQPEPPGRTGKTLHIPLTARWRLPRRTLFLEANRTLRSRPLHLKKTILARSWNLFTLHFGRRNRLHNKRQSSLTAETTASRSYPQKGWNPLFDYRLPVRCVPISSCV